MFVIPRSDRQGSNGLFRTLDQQFVVIVIPAGKNLAVVTDSEMKPTKSGNGSYLELTLQIIDGEYKTLDDPSESA